jgi:hypothetical protein
MIRHRPRSLSDGAFRPMSSAAAGNRLSQTFWPRIPANAASPSLQMTRAFASRRGGREKSPEMLRFEALNLNSNAPSNRAVLRSEVRSKKSLAVEGSKIALGQGTGLPLWACNSVTAPIYWRCFGRR